MHALLLFSLFENQSVLVPAIPLGNITHIEKTRFCRDKSLHQLETYCEISDIYQSAMMQRLREFLRFFAFWGI